MLKKWIENWTSSSSVNEPTTADWIAAAKEIIKADEGLRLKPYRDSEGILTIGYGRNLQFDGITEREALFLLRTDVEDALDACYSLYGEIRFSKFGDARKAALLCMAFQLGETRLRLFKEMNQAILADDWIGARKAALESKWAREDSPKRAKRIVELFNE